MSLGLALTAIVSQQGSAMPPQDQGSSPPAGVLVVLTGTGEIRDGLPVLTTHDSASFIGASLRRGFGGVALRLFQMEQHYLETHQGTAVEPAYLLLSETEGGFPRFGFYLDGERKADVGFVDLHRSKPMSGRFGAMDQIFPHELAHVLLTQLAGAPGRGGSNQVHAVGLRTDLSYAFHEGFAEHFQVLAVDHPDAAPDTRALATDSLQLRRMRDNLGAYRREILAPWGPLGRMRMTFPLWYSGAEQALRYHAVKENSFAREVPLPESLLETGSLYDAYLLENSLPGSQDSSTRSRRRMEATEGVVAHLFLRWGESEGLRTTWREDSFYAQFGVNRDAIAPTENLYLKLFHAMYRARPGTVAQLVAAYRREFPDEAPYVDSVVEEAFQGQAPVVAPELWLANPDFSTGTSLFDQLRGSPRIHTFDLNGASLTDLVTVPGVDMGLAGRILRSGPYEDVGHLAAVDGVSVDVLRRFEAMRDEMTRLTSSSDDRETELSLLAIIRPYVLRLLTLMALASLLGAGAYRALRKRSNLEDLSPFRLVTNGFGASALALVGGWMLGGFPLGYAVGTVALVLGLPGALLGFLRCRHVGHALWILAAWVGAAIPMAILITPFP